MVAAEVRRRTLARTNTSASLPRRLQFLQRFLNARGTGRMTLPMRNGNPLRGSERQCAKIMARVERKREPERSVPRILAIVTSYRRWVVLLHNHSISLLFL